MSSRPTSVRGFVAAHRWAIAGAVVLLLLAVASIQVLRARASLNAGAADLTTALRLANEKGGIGSQHRRAAVVRAVTDAHAEFASAEFDLWPLNPVLGHLGWVPAVGAQAESAYPLADAGAGTTSGVLDIVNGLAGAWSELDSSSRSRPLLASIAPTLPSGVSQFRRAGLDFSVAAGELRSVPAHLGSESLDREVNRLRRAVRSLGGAARWLTISPDLLGDNRPSQLLVVWQNPDQIRPTGGFIPAATLLTINRGTVRTRPFGSFLTSNVSVPVPAPEAAYTGEGSLLFEDSNWSPDFPLSARYERWMFGISTGIRVPTIVNLSGATSILSATGPIYVRQYHRWVNASNVGYWIEYYHLRYVHNRANEALGKRNPALSDTRSQRFLSDLFSDIMSRVQHIRGPGIFRLAAGIHHAIVDQTLLMYSRDRAMEAAIRSAGADGAIGPVPHDSLLVVDDNLSYNKINPYVSERASYTVTIGHDGSATGVLRVRYHNRHSPATLYGTGPFDGRFAKHTYQDFIRLYAPPGSQLASVRGIDRCRAAGRGSGLCSSVPAYGMTEFGDGMTIREKHTRVAVWRYRLPSGIFHAAGVGRYLLTIRRQPSSAIHAIRITVHVPPGETVGGDGRTWTRLVPLRTGTATVSVPISGATGHPAALSIEHGPWSDPWLPNRLFNTPMESF